MPLKLTSSNPAPSPDHPIRRIIPDVFQEPDVYQEKVWVRRVQQYNVWAILASAIRPTQWPERHILHTTWLEHDTARLSFFHRRIGRRGWAGRIGFSPQQKSGRFLFYRRRQNAIDRHPAPKARHRSRASAAPTQPRHRNRCSQSRAR